MRMSILTFCFCFPEFVKKLGKLVAVISENCSTNGSMSKQFGPIFAGRHKYGRSLAVSEIFELVSKNTLKV